MFSFDRSKVPIPSCFSFDSCVLFCVSFAVSNHCCHPGERERKNLHLILRNSNVCVMWPFISGIANCGWGANGCWRAFRYIWRLVGINTPRISLLLFLFRGDSTFLGSSTQTGGVCERKKKDFRDKF